MYFLGKQYEFFTSKMAESMNSCLMVSRELQIVALIEKIRAKIAEFFYKRNLQVNSMIALVTPQLLSVLQEMEEITAKTSQDFGPPSIFRSIPMLKHLMM